MRLSGTKAQSINQYRGLGNQLWDLAGERPTLDHRFADDKSLIDATTGQTLINFTRASSGTYVDSQGVIRTATTNLIWPSEDFVTNWGLAGATRFADAGIAPNGTLTADRIESTGGGVFKSGVSVVSGVAYTYSVYIKHVSGTGVLSNIGFERFGSVPLAGQTSFNVLTGTVVSNGAAVTASSITPAGDGWYRVSVRATSADTTATIINYAAASGNQFLLWGAQLEQSSTVGEYIPTTSTINSAPRFDHNPTTGESLGLLVEEQRTNLLLRSEEFDNASWVKITASVSANVNTSPSGGSTADKLIVDNGQSAGYVVQATSFTSGTTYTASCYAKAGEASDFRFVFESGAFGSNLNAIFNLSTGVVSSFTTSSASIQNVGNGWYRCIATAVATITASAGVQFRSVHAGNGVNGILIWGAQLEAGSFPTSYIPTTTAAVTRSADVASISGSNFSSWYRQDEGTVFAEYRLPAAGIGIVNIDDGTANNNIPIFVGAAVLQAASANAIVAGVNNGRLDSGGSFTANSLTRAAYAIKVADRALSANGATATTSATPSAMPVVTQLQIQGTTTFTSGKGGTIRRLTYWPQRLPNSTLQQITQ